MVLPLAALSHEAANKRDRSLTPSNSRPHTPTSSSSKSNARYAAQSPPPRAKSAISPPAKRPSYSQPISHTINAWSVDAEDEDHTEDGAGEYYLNENANEDEFGLPSITSSRRDAKRRIPVNKSIDPGGGVPGSTNGSSYTLSSERSSAHSRANDSDIADERGPPNYPMAKKSEGKILRPQYKDILRGSDPQQAPHLSANTKAQTLQIPSTSSVTRQSRRTQPPRKPKLTQLESHASTSSSAYFKQAPYR